VNFLNGTTGPMFQPLPTWGVVLIFEVLTVLVELGIIVPLFFEEGECKHWKKLAFLIVVGNACSFVIGIFIWLMLFTRGYGW
jgi:hypothetical protein